MSMSEQGMSTPGIDISLRPIMTALVDNLRVEVYRDRKQLGMAAGRKVGAQLATVLERQAQARAIFAAAPSQNEFLKALAEFDGIDWSRVSVFHMDEYLGLPADAPQCFGRFLSEQLFDRVHPGEVHLIRDEDTPEEECWRYGRLLAAAPIDIVCLGIGENGHIAFNDPPVADFNDPALVKMVELDLASREQQVHDGCFSALEHVPTHALTVTIPTLLSGRSLFCMVPGAAKREAVRGVLYGPVTTTCPASALRTHPDCTLYLETDSYPPSG